MRDLAARTAAISTAIDDNAFLGSPDRQHLRQQFVPAIFIEQQSARHMLTLELFLRPRIDPDRVGAPSLRERYHFRSGNRGLPRDFVAVINRLAHGGKQSEAD